MPKRRCPTPDKQAHRTKAEAEGHRLAMARKLRGWSLQSYKCRCGSWHVGRKPPRKPRQR